MSKAQKTLIIVMAIVFALTACGTPGTAVQSSTPAKIEDTAESPVFWGATTQDEAINTGYCPPGSLRVVSGVWESCSGSDWDVVDPLYRWTNRDAFTASLNGNENYILVPLFAITVADPIPGDEFLVMMLKGSIVAIFSGQAAVSLQNQAVWSGTTFDGFQEWEAGYGTDLILPAGMVEDQVGIVAMAPTVEAGDIDIQAPTGSLAVVIEDNAMWASLIVANLAQQGIITVGAYPSCAAWRAGIVKLAHVYVVDQHSEGQAPGHTCVAEIAALLPPPLLIFAYTSENLDRITRLWSDEESTVRELFEENGADMVLNKKSDMFELIWHVVHGLTGS